MLLHPMIPIGSATRPLIGSAVRQLGDARRTLAAFDFDHHVIVDSQAIGRDVLLRFSVRPLIREPVGTGER